MKSIPVYFWTLRWTQCQFLPGAKRRPYTACRCTTIKNLPSSNDESQNQLHYCGCSKTNCKPKEKKSSCTYESEGISSRYLRKNQNNYLSRFLFFIKAYVVLHVSTGWLLDSMTEIYTQSMHVFDYCLCYCLFVLSVPTIFTTIRDFLLLRDKITCLRLLLNLRSLAGTIPRAST